MCSPIVDAIWTECYPICIRSRYARPHVQPMTALRRLRAEADKLVPNKWALCCRPIFIDDDYTTVRLRFADDQSCTQFFLNCNAPYRN
jgi:hypothetical protein